MLKGFKPPFEVLDKGVYTRIVDSKGETVTFMFMSEHMGANARLIVEMLNNGNQKPLNTNNDL